MEALLSLSCKGTSFSYGRRLQKSSDRHIRISIRLWGRPVVVTPEDVSTTEPGTTDTVVRDSVPPWSHTRFMLSDVIPLPPG